MRARIIVARACFSQFLLSPHILLSAIDEWAEGFRECFARLGVKGIISEDLASRLSSAARLRNLLVHRYRVIDDEKVYNSIKKGLGDFEDFVGHVRGFVKRDKA